MNLLNSSWRGLGISKNPFPSSASFQKDDAQYFRAKGSPNRGDELLLARRIVLLAGLSRYGKTSLIQAGLLPSIGNRFLMPIDSKNQPLFIRLRDTPPQNVELKRF